MKNLVLLIIILIITTCCSHRPSDDKLNLGPYSRDLCSLIIRAQMAPMIEPHEIACSLRNEVAQRLGNDTSSHTRAVKLYIDDGLRNAGCSEESRRALLDSASILVDSINYPAMKHRIRAEILKLRAPFTKKRYYEIKQEIDYFEHIGDTLAMALLEVSLGPDFIGVGCAEEAMEITKKL